MVAEDRELVGALREAPLQELAAKQQPGTKYQKSETRNQETAILSRIIAIDGYPGTILSPTIPIDGYLYHPIT